jgi:hypothetical protein
VNLFRSKMAPATRKAFSSPKYLVRCAAALIALFLAAHFAGLREFTSILNGTIGSTAMNWESAAILGVVYIGLYLAFVLLVPVLVLAAMILTLGSALRKTGFIRTEPALPGPMSERPPVANPH